MYCREGMTSLGLVWGTGIGRESSCAVYGSVKSLQLEQMLWVPCDSRYDFLPFLPSFRPHVFLFFFYSLLISIFRLNSRGLVLQEWRFTVQVILVLLPFCINNIWFWHAEENESTDVKSWWKHGVFLGWVA